MIAISFASDLITDCASAVVVPAKALEEPGYIQTFSDSRSASAKHEFHALSQMAYFQYQDDELVVRRVEGEIRIAAGDDREEIFPRAMVLYRDGEGALHVLIHETLPAKKMLEAAYRFCTRWVRLDI